MKNSFTHTVLTIAGSDPYGGAGVRVDSKVIHVLGGYALSVVTASTAQNSTGVKDVWVTPTAHFEMQLETLLNDIKVDALKIGMLGNAEKINSIIKYIKEYDIKNIVLDTPFVSTSGKVLLDTSGIESMVKNLFPLADMITPNIPEINALLGTNYEGKEDEIESMSKGLFDLGAKAVLIKGGHSQNNEYATDYLVIPNRNPIAYTSPRVDTSHTHGTGCVLSSAIATYLVKGFGLEKSVKKAKDFLYQRLDTSSALQLKYSNKNQDRKEPLL